MDIDAQKLRSEYTAKFCNKVQKLVAKREEMCISQSIIADMAGKPLRTIQKFENYGCFDYYLIFVYEQVLKR